MVGFEFIELMDSVMHLYWLSCICLAQAHVAGSRLISTQRFDDVDIKSCSCMFNVHMVAPKWLGGLDAYLKGTKATKAVMHSSFKFIAGGDC